MLADKARPQRAIGGGPAKDWLRALERTARLERDPTRTLVQVVDEWAASRGEAMALVSDHARLTYGGLARRSRVYAAWAIAQGLGFGDVAALVAQNQPEYLAVWLGLSRIGVTTALVNPQLRGASLAHALAVAAPKRIIVDAACAAETFGAAESLGLEGSVWSFAGRACGLPSIEAPDRIHDHPPTERPPTLGDRALLVYTSGTTGLPKAANVSHRRVMTWSGWFAGLLDIRPDDRLYACLPLCHSAGGVAAVGAALAAGATVVIAEKFSASRFWDDIARWDCTLFQYVGELCRYLLAAPPHPLERAHRLRATSGNGLGGDGWTRFQERFAVPRILEFYASTEGNFSLFNVEGRPGAIGRLPGFIAHRSAVEIVRFDHALGAPLRDENGRCVRCGPDETGEAIGRVSAGGAGRFEGYTDAGASAAKLLCDVFEPGDVWLRTGDLMRRDAQGFFYFVDRIGDTFRWKGENASAAEVTSALRATPGVADACVYGVAVPGASGKAGMAAIVPQADFDLRVLRKRLAQALPEFARPVFLRLASRIETTATFKQQKAALADDGWDVARVSEPLFVDDRAAGAYRPLTSDLARRIREGDLRL